MSVPNRLGNVQLEKGVIMEEQIVEDLGETGPIHINHVDLSKTPRQLLAPITRMALAQSAIIVTSRRPIPQMRIKDRTSAASRLQAAPETIPPRSEGRVGRNNPCPCGSSKKFGKCCLPKLKK